MRQNLSRDNPNLQEIYDKKILKGESFSENGREKSGRGSCEYKKDKTNIIHFTEEQKLLAEFLINKGYEFLEDIGEDLIFARSDFLQK